MDVLQCIRCDKFLEFLEASMFVGKTGKKQKHHVQTVDKKSYKLIILLNL
jgi:hypothetical protein